jgi:adenylate cyclase
MSGSDASDLIGKSPDRRKLIAVVYADMVGYSRLIGLDDAGTLQRLRRLRTEVIDPAIEEHDGRVVQTGGDSLLIVFDSIDGAVRCAVEVQQQVPIHDGDQPPDRSIRFRVGINIGDAIADGTDLHGDAVNVVARLQAECPPGSICVSRSVRDHVHGRLDLTFEELGSLNLKNIARPVEAFVLKVDAAATPAKSVERFLVHNTTRDLPLLNKPSIAVLAFTDMSGGPDQEYFSDGVADDIITGLSRIRWLYVIARNSSFIYKGKAVDVKRVGRELGVRYVLEGSVRKAGNRVRITSQLIDAQSSAHLWAERYDRSLDDIFALQDEIALSVVGAIEPSLRQAEIERVKRKRPESLDAYDLVLQALPFTYSRMPDDASEAIRLLQKALELDPGYAFAQATLAFCFNARFIRGDHSPEDYAASLHHARIAVMLGCDDATGLAFAAFVFATSRERDMETVLGLFDRALSLSPSSTIAMGYSALVLSWMGRTDTAIERAQQALRLSPFDPYNFFAHNALALAYYFEGHYDRAVEAARRMVENSPRFSYGHAILAAVLARLGQIKDAEAAAHRTLALEPGFRISSMAAMFYLPRDAKKNATFTDALRAAGLPE